MIAAATAKNIGEAPVNYLVADVRNLPAAARFDGAFTWYTSFGYEDDAGNLDVLRGVRAQLSDGGRFAVDVTNKDFLVRNFRETTVFERGDNFMIDRLSYDTQTSRMRNDRVYIRSGVRRASFSLRLYSLPELSELLARAGFDSIEPHLPEDRSQASLHAFGLRRGRFDLTHRGSLNNSPY
jgi:hypothetical protein